MTALSDALAVAQARTVQALSRVYLADKDESPAAFVEALDKIGLTDKLEQEQLVACLTALRSVGAALPEANGATKPEEKASDKQRDYLHKLADEKGFASPFYDGMTKARASELIDKLQAGTYDPAKDDVPF